MKCLSTGEAAAILGVSGATVRNWFRAGYLAAVATNPLSFLESEILSLTERIKTNRFNRLRKRANKTASERVNVSDIDDPGIAADLAKIGALILAERIDPQSFIFLAALKLLRAAGEVRLPDIGGEFHPEFAEWRRESVKAIMRDWAMRHGNRLCRVPDEAFDYFLSRDDYADRLGLLYQGLLSVGRRSRTGTYFTSLDIIDESLRSLDPPPSSFLDPCCGTGRYLVRAASRFNIDPSRLYGFDSDPAAIDIARLNILLHYRDTDAMPMMRCLDSLNDLANGCPDCDTNHLLGSVDAVATNPPWGGCKNLPRHRNLASLVKSGESFSMFLEKSLRLLRQGGQLSFLLPESMLKIKTHSEIRKLLLENCAIKKITMLGRVFPGVFTHIVRLDLEKRPAPPEWDVKVERPGAGYRVPQTRFLANAGCAFDVAVTPGDGRLIGKIYSRPYQTLRHNADWALGIVTGDNTRHVLSAPVAGSEPIVRGRDVYKFAARPPRCHIRFRPREFQQVAPEHIYRAPEKLIYRFVSERLVFAYDDTGLLTLNSANILIPRLPGLSIKAAMAFLNSGVFQYIFTKRFHTRKILRGDLETLPFPILGDEAARRIEAQVDLCMGGDYGPADELDRMICAAFGLDDGDVATLEDGLDQEAKTVIL